MYGKADAKEASVVRSACFPQFVQTPHRETPGEIDGCDRKLPFCKVGRGEK